MNRDEEATGIGMFQLAVEDCLRSVNEERTLTSDQKQQDDWEVFFVHGGICLYMFVPKAS